MAPRASDVVDCRAGSSGRRARRSPSGSRHRHERYEKRHSARRRLSRSPRGRRDRYEHRAHSRRRDSYDSGHRQRRQSREREYDDNGGYADDGHANGNAYGSNNAKDASDDSAAHDDSVGTYDGRPGDYILSRYKILREAGVGTFGRVLECVDKKRNEIVAIKVVRKVDKYTESAKVSSRRPCGSRGVTGLTNVDRWSCRLDRGEHPAGRERQGRAERVAVCAHAQVVRSTLARVLAMVGGAC